MGRANLFSFEFLPYDVSRIVAASESVTQNLRLCSDDMAIRRSDAISCRKTSFFRRKQSCESGLKTGIVNQTRYVRFSPANPVFSAMPKGDARRLRRWRNSVGERVVPKSHIAGFIDKTCFLQPGDPNATGAESGCCTHSTIIRATRLPQIAKCKAIRSARLTDVLRDSERWSALPKNRAQKRGAVYASAKNTGIL